MYQLSTLGHNDAQRAIQAIQAEALKRGKAITVAVGDARGELIGLLRLDGALLPSVTVATNKVFTAARENKTTQQIGQAVRDPKNGFDIAYFGDSRFIGWSGGLPVIINGATVGAVAVSGVTPEEDAELAQIGVTAITAGK
ncbi:MAG TPA: heme-binding protein [Burkholderiales bacterium]|nr:heme-binding protein [Burkholderiales bacterium]